MKREGVVNIMTRSEIAKKLKLYREKAGFTQAAVAQIINRKQQTVASWETGQGQPDMDTYFALCDLYGITAEQFRGSNKKTPAEVENIDLGMSIDEIVERYSKLHVDMRRMITQLFLMCEMWQSTQPMRTVEGQELEQIICQRVLESLNLQQEPSEPQEIEQNG
jgi:transcriptional regulator with XRE-family HTH domain